MLQLDSISRIGFGSYRVSSTNKTHANSLRVALDGGCNVLDTAPNYSLGEAEELIGEVIKERKREDFFIMTKAGYLQGVLNNTLKTKLRKIPGAIKSISLNQYYSIHPDLLYYQITQSLKRLNTSYLDGFFLHNPHYLGNGTEIQRQLLPAIEFLEDMVDKKKLRYYGISSEKLSIDINSPLNIDSLNIAASSVNSNHHCKLFQFPFNILENDLIKKIEGEHNLIEYCKKIDAKTFSNRPLNAYLKNGQFIRLAHTTTTNIFDIELEDDFKNAFQLAFEFSQRHGTKTSFKWQNICNVWRNFQSDESVQSHFSSIVMPEALEFYSNKIPPIFLLQINRMKKICITMARKNMAKLTATFYKSIFSQVDLLECEYARTAINYCKLQGIDCILTGIRKPSYFNDIKDLL